MNAGVLPSSLKHPHQQNLLATYHVRVEDDPATRRATCVLGDVETGAKAAEVFEVIWSHGEPLSC